jgi:hypothetical protein
MLIRRSRHATSLLVCIALAGCAAAESTVGLQIAPLPSAPVLAAKTALPAQGRSRTSVWVGDLGDGKVRHYVGPNYKSACQFTGAGGFEGIFVDDVGNVYAVNPSGQLIDVLSEKCKVESVLSDTGYFPVDVSVEPDGSVPDGTIAITNYSSSSFGAGNIVFFKGSRIGVATGLLTNFLFGAFDRSGNFYTDGFTASGAVAVGRVAAGSTSVKPTRISGIGYPGGIAIAKNGTINIDDQDCSCIKIFKSNGAADGTVNLNGTSDAVSFAFNRENTALWVADAASGTVSKYAYPDGGAALSGVSGLNEPFGVGVYPAAQP